MSLIKGNHGGLGGAGAPGGALGSFFSSTIDNSVRLVGNSTAASSARLTQTFGTVDSATDFTLNFWIKRNEILNPVNSGYPQFIFNFRDGTSGTALNDLCFLASGSYGVGASLVLTATNSASYILSTNNLFRDFSAWYNIHIMGDLNNGTASEKLKFFINGVEASYATDNRGSYTSLVGLKAGAWTIGDYYGYSYPTGSSIARWAFVDNSTLAASYFGEFKDGVWIPKALAGITWGSAGHLLEFGATGTSQNSSGIGADTSGETNHWAVANIAAHDVLPDSPTNNFATMNPLMIGDARVHSSAVYSEGNLKVLAGGYSTSTVGGGFSSIAIPSDKKIYVEVCETNSTEFGAGVLIQDHVQNNTQMSGNGSVTYYNRSVIVNGTETDYGSSAGAGGLGVARLAAGDVLGIAVDGATGKVWFHRNGTYFKSPSTNNSGTTGNPSAGSNEIGTVTNTTAINPSGNLFFFLTGNSSTDNLFINFGQDSTFAGNKSAGSETDANGEGLFQYAVPTDYVCLHSGNMSDPAIGPAQSSQADDYFNTVLYTGNGSTQSITGVGFQPDWSWLKARDGAGSGRQHMLFDSLRGATKDLNSHNTSAEATVSTSLTSFDSDGFSIGADSDVNTNAESFVSWNWNAGGAPTANNSAGNGATPTAGSVKIDGSNLGSALAGSLAATKLSANTTAGFSVVTWTAASDSGTVAHGLTSAPEMIIAKPLGDGTNWYVMHTPGAVVPASNVLNLDSTAAAFNPGVNHFDDTYPTSTVFSFGGYLGDDLSNDDKVAYCFHSVEGYSKIGSYTGNGNADGTFVYTGFRPAWIMVKQSSGGSTGWLIYDTARDTFNEADAVLQAHVTTAEVTAADIDIVSNGWKFRTNDSAVNGSSATYIYLAFAEAPFKFANAR